jgi:ABC-type nitrate/sulfonate/bicarbonate transport system permease component
MYVSLILVALLGYLSQLGLARLERVLIPWRRPAKPPAS